MFDFFFSWSLSFFESYIEPSAVPALCRAVDTNDAAEVAKRGRRRKLLAKASFPDDVRSSRSTSFSICLSQAQFLMHPRVFYPESQTVTPFKHHGWCDLVSHEEYIILM